MIGQTIGSYRIISQLGAGAMGEVYLAEHRHLKRKAALKLLARELVGRPDLLERFFLEARATSAIAHAGIVQVFDCEIDSTGRPYIVMEYLAGETLAARLTRTGPLPPPLVARLVCAIAEALDAAHAKGIVHRDLKPENIFVDTTAADLGKVAIKLVDFGIAKLAGDFRAGQVHQTHAGSVIGTPLYMSPEQCRDSASVDFRSDLYALGCVMFEMLTGRPPFTHPGLADLMVAHLTEQPKDLRAVNAAIPATLAELCGSLLQKDPQLRPASMRQLIERLEQYIATPETATATATAPAAAPAAAPVLEFPFVATARAKTTFGEAATEIVTQSDAPVGEEAATASRRGRIILVAGLAAAAALALAAVGLLRGRSSPAAPHSDLAVATTAAAPAATSVAPSEAAPPPQPGNPPQGAKRTASPGGTPQGKPARRAAATRKLAEGPGSVTSKDRTIRGGTSAAVAATVPGPTVVGAAVNGTAKPSAPEPREREPTLPPPPTQVATSSPVNVPPVQPRQVGLTGTWEGPWNDVGKQQNGRLYLQVGSDGVVSGWMFNRAAGQSFRLVGKMSAAGEVDLACRCPPNQGFAARGAVHVASNGGLTGQLSLSTAAGVFGRSQLTLHRAPAR